MTKKEEKELDDLFNEDLFDLDTDTEEEKKEESKKKEKSKEATKGTFEIVWAREIKTKKGGSFFREVKVPNIKRIDGENYHRLEDRSLVLVHKVCKLTYDDSNGKTIYINDLDGFINGPFAKKIEEKENKK